ncbi:hypothetical protein BGHDH14_bgh02125 [Blumeria hordei DH14]|uniref:HCP-like protein n=1 Tax=Blumeria graminis f. sp. hordei (strain DH14) TaxID=546991 RepID=N1JDP6_BLUG1|nr:hypothetical protein BGHDH14_bgh02125 [Blumeria hordei DH14]
MPLRQILKKKENLDRRIVEDPLTIPVLFVRTDTNTQEIIFPPNSPTTDEQPLPTTKNGRPKKTRIFLLKKWCSITRVYHMPKPSDPSHKSSISISRRLSSWLELKRDKPPKRVLKKVPNIGKVVENVNDKGPVHEVEWEKRATSMAKLNHEAQNRPISSASKHNLLPHLTPIKEATRSDQAGLQPKNVDDSLQEAIRLHEAGELGTSTIMFGRLADPSGENNALSQVLYGLSLRHGWGCTPNPEEAVKYLSAAAANSALIEDLALQAGINRGGAAKGELVLAIYELANCFRHGWGVQTDKVAAKQYYETAANLGDADAMNEVARCYLDGFGCKKDKFAAAKYYRLAEREGNKIMGNSWIWKDKYNPVKATKS